MRYEPNMSVTSGLDGMDGARREQAINAFWDAWEGSGFGCAQVARQVGISLADAQRLLSTREGLPVPCAATAQSAGFCLG